MTEEPDRVAHRHEDTRDPDSVADRIARHVGRIGTFREEMAAMPKLQRRIVYISMFCMFMLFVQSVFIMPVILIKFGWGYNVG